MVEPVLRDADIVTLDINSVKSSEVSLKQNTSPNGLMAVKFVPFQDMRELVIKSLLLGFMSTTLPR